MDALLFGLSGLVLEPRTAAGRAQVESAAGVMDDPVAFWRGYDDLRPSYEVGDVSDARWWRQLAIRARLDDPDIQEAVAADVETLSRPRREMVDVILDLVDSGFTCGAIDNVPPVLAMHLRRSHPWLDDLAAVTFSCDIGVAKPDPEALRVAIDAMGVKTASTLYVDYRQDWVDAAGQLGMSALVATDPASIKQALA